ncbi:hypothetical protein MNBD_GAMMA18-1536 [hydrothermal vent metagenome]|uniref:Peptidase M48 domain-containing protein n=1 Tax=hydrothermal vent metagenome TaxID=652676 RepID=A0A3B0ZLE4_9ZZZZ
MKQFNNNMVVVIFFIGLLSACGTENRPSTTAQPLPIEKTDPGSEAQFEYLLQFSGGRYVAEPALNEYLTAIGGRLTRLAGYEVLKNQFAVVNSHRVDAWVSSEGRVAITLGMLTTLSNEAELAALLGHLLAHAAQQHSATAIARGITITPELLAKKAEHPYAQYIVGAGLPVLAQQTIRYNPVTEQKADHAAMTTMIKAGYDPQAAIDLQFKKSADAEGKIHWLNHYQPNRERLVASRQHAHNHPSGLSMSESSYQDAIEQLSQYKEAYQQQPQLQQLLNQGQAEAAYTLAQKLTLAVPHEGRFFALKGDALQQMDKIADAIEAYNQALEHDPRYFAYHLRLAELQMLQQATVAAQTTFLNSIQRLPTAKGYLWLAQLAEQQGELAQAQEYYQRAARSNTPLGKQAEKETQKIDFAENPNRYIHIKHQRVDSNKLRLFVTNINPHSVQIETLLLNTDQTYRIRLDQSIPAGNSISSTVTINDLGEIQSIAVDKAQLMP